MNLRRIFWISLFIIGIEVCAIVLFLSKLKCDMYCFDIENLETLFQIINGCIISLLTGVNIFVFYKLTVVTEQKNNNRDIRSKVFEAQSILTQMRLRQYNEIQTIANDIKLRIYSNSLNSKSIIDIIKSLSLLKDSLLFKNDVEAHDTFLYPHIKEICDILEACKDADLTPDIKDKLANAMTNLIKTIEFYIVSQMIRDKEVFAYLNFNKGHIDSTINCILQKLDEIRYNK